MTSKKKQNPLERKIQEYCDKYYGYVVNIAQIYPDPKVNNCYVVRFENGEYSDNFACVLNFNFEDPMIEDGIELEPGQKITKKMFGNLNFGL